MKIQDFLTEQWMNEHERQAKINLTDTSAAPLSVDDLEAFEPGFLKGLTLDYGWITGDPGLRQEILSLYVDQREETLTMTNGALQANELVMNILLKPGDHVVTLIPGYQQFSEYPRWLGCDVTEVPFDESNGWSVDFDALEAEFARGTRLLVFASPSNPTGTWLDREQTRQLADLAARYNVWVLCDEVYRSYEQDELSISDIYKKGVATGSLSKQFGLAGVRLGWVKGCPELIEEVNVFRDYTLICAGPLSEKAALTALRHKNEILRRTHQIIDRNKADLTVWLKSSSNFSCQLPAKGTVSFLKIPEGLSSREFALDLLDETGIFFVPGWCFDKDGYVRLSLGRKFDDLPGVLKTLEDWTEQYLDRKNVAIS